MIIKNPYNKYYFWVLVLLFIAFFVFILNCTKKDGLASSESLVLTSQPEWQAGDYDPVILDLTTVPGSMMLAESSKVEIDNNNITASADILNKNNINDENVSTFWQSWVYSAGEVAWLKVNIGNISAVSRICEYGAIGPVSMQASDDDIAYVDFDYSIPGDSWHCHDYSPVQKMQYLRFYIEGSDGGPSEATISELEIYASPLAATHTSAPTQLDGGAEFSNWTTFSATQSVPENTTLSYKFRTSPDATNWTDYSASQTYSGTPIDLSTLVTSESGDTKYRYIQVESTFESTDGVSTPTLSDYTLNYETAGLCDNFDHLSITPASTSVNSGGTTDIIATPEDATDNTLPNISLSYSTDCGSIDSTGKYTAPFVEQTTFCTVTVTSDCGGKATSTIQVYGDWVDAQPEPDCNLSLKVLEPTKDSQYLIGDNLNIIFTPKDSSEDSLYNGHEIRYDIMLSLNQGKTWQTIAKAQKDINFPDQESYQSLSSQDNWTNLLQNNSFSYQLPDNQTYLSSKAIVKVWMYRVSDNPQGCYDRVAADSPFFVIKEKQTSCEDTRLILTSPKNTFSSKEEENLFYLDLTEEELEAWQEEKLNLNFQASVVDPNLVSISSGDKERTFNPTPAIIRTLESEDFKLVPSSIGQLDQESKLEIDYKANPKAKEFKLTAYDSLCDRSITLLVKTPENTQDETKEITLTSPNGGEKWALTEKRAITWQSHNLDQTAASLDILLSTNSGESYDKKIVNNLSLKDNQLKDNQEQETFTSDNLNSYQWQIPNDNSYLTDQARVKIIVYDDLGKKITEDSSDNDFRIKNSLVGAAAILDNIFNNIDDISRGALILTTLSALLSSLSPLINAARAILISGKRKKRSLGTVYSATSGEPQAGVAVSLFDAKTKRLLKTDLTDSRGRFNFILTPGKYFIKIKDKELTIASNLSKTVKRSLYYGDNYFGEVFTIGNMEHEAGSMKNEEQISSSTQTNTQAQAINLNAVMEHEAGNTENKDNVIANEVKQSNNQTFSEISSPAGLTMTGKRSSAQNEFQTLYNIPTIEKREKESRSLAFLNLKNKLLKTLIYLDWPLLIAGTIFSIIALIKSLDIINILIITIYLFLWAKHSITRPIGRSFGIVLDEDTKRPISLAIVRALDYKTKKLIQSSVTSRAGHFTLNLQKGYYLLTVQKWGYVCSNPIEIELKEDNKTINKNIYLKGLKKEEIFGRPKKLHNQHMPQYQLKQSRKTNSLNEIIENYSGEIGE